MVRVFSWLLLLLALPAILAEHEASQSTAPAWEPGAVSGVSVSLLVQGTVVRLMSTQGTFIQMAGRCAAAVPLWCGVVAATWCLCLG